MVLGLYHILIQVTLRIIYFLKLLSTSGNYRVMEPGLPVLTQIVRRYYVRVTPTSSKERAHHPPHISRGCTVLFSSQHGRPRKSSNTKDSCNRKTQPTKHAPSSVSDDHYSSHRCLSCHTAGGAMTRDSPHIQNITEMLRLERMPR